MLFIQQRERYLIAYSIYLFSLSCYISFKLLSNNYNPYEESEDLHFYFMEEFLQILMVCIYASFAAITLNVTRRDKAVLALWIIVLTAGTISISIHIYNGIGVETAHISRLRYAISRFTIVGASVAALSIVWQTRKTIFERTIIFGSFVYAFAGLLSTISFSTNRWVMGLKDIEPYLIGCLLDIVIFSSAFGYRIKEIALEKNKLLKAELDAQHAISMMRTDIASNLHDDIGSTLSSISIYSAAAQQSVIQNEKEKAIKYLKQLGNEARDTISNMSDIVWAINPRNDSADRLIARMKSYATEMCSAKGIQLTMDVQSFEEMGNWSMAVRNNFYLIFKEAINNSVKYSDSPTLEIIFMKTTEGLELKVKDLGVGFDLEDPNETGSPSNSFTQNVGGNGIINMRERANDISAKLSIHSAKNGMGTEVILCLGQINSRHDRQN
jgi:signal transduction histidine kinase